MAGIKNASIKHYAEKASKSTTSHARIFAPQSTSIYHYPNMPSVKNKSKAILVYPCKDSCTIEALSSKISHGQLDQVIFIDSTWNQATSIFQTTSETTIDIFSDDRGYILFLCGVSQVHFEKRIPWRV
ncbi:uncharacterized protein TRIADDRAFT_53513 [Trichoplax adhaerens]|uniref:tRNA-uridine aminocarboxypropyltransferase 1 n=1 Tax=Trichoplax adhaerens TaxID=10228 RepID=B3RPF2_TRIAD|nr:hypothetical protein TRIADDRAFT_53513 [Trichoplax adhaerens]EDV27624.1 hypothetical protein TRIADDRAFT_53513 [Trichoplax adhaerens]|eukprot:XP_002109458.1 hypothetical protein TRIADDRAFT_53513 [Trichoplax adhaerens]